MTTIKLKGGKHKEPTKYKSGQFFRANNGDLLVLTLMSWSEEGGRNTTYRLVCIDPTHAVKLNHLRGEDLVSEHNHNDSFFTISEILEATNSREFTSITPISVTISED